VSRKSIPEEAGVLHDKTATLKRLVDTRHGIAILGIDREESAAGPIFAAQADLPGEKII